jgi:hypothetical protein
VSSDTSPPSGYRLDNPARTPGATGDVSVRKTPITAEPSWIKVIGTTLSLWVRRRILHVPDTGRIGRARATALAVVAVVLVAAIAGGAIAAVAAVAGKPVSHHTALPRATKPKLTPAQKQAQAAAARAVAANTTAAATWIAAEVSEQAVIGCDPGTCAAIEQAGSANGGQVVLQPGVSLPAGGAVVVATPIVRAQYGAQLEATAPEIIAAFGTGSQTVQIRVVVPGGQAAYSQAASSAIVAQRSAGLKLIADRKVHAYPAPRQALTAGLVDLRLLTVLQRLAARYPVDIYSFSDGGGPLVDGSAPYRLAEIIGLTNKRTVTAIARQLTGLPDSARPALSIIRGPAGNYGLTLRFKAPSPG